MFDYFFKIEQNSSKNKNGYKISLMTTDKQNTISKRIEIKKTAKVSQNYISKHPCKPYNGRHKKNKTQQCIKNVKKHIY